MYAIDAAATHAFNAVAGRSPALDAAMIAIAQWAVPALVVAVALQWWRRSGDRACDRHILVAAGLSFLLGLAINQAILLVVDRPRPYDAGITHLIVARSQDPSFPSDHATAIAAIAAAFLLHRAPRRGIAFLIAALLVAASRVFVGIHYVGDVAGGVAIGFLAAAIVTVAHRPGTRIDRLLTGIL